MVLVIILCLFFLPVAALMFLPLTLVVNTNQNKYNISQPGIFRVDLLWHKDALPKLSFRVLFFKFKINAAKGKKRVPTKERKRSVRKIKKPLWLMKKILRKIHLKRFYADIDTGDFPLNAQLIPVCNSLGHPNVDININFFNTNRVDIKVMAFPYELILVLIGHWAATHIGPK